LGAFGGALARGKDGKASYHLVWFSTSIAGMLVAALAFIVSVVIYSLLPGQITSASAEYGLTLSLPMWTLTNLPALTCLGFFLLFQVIGWLALRGLLAASEPTSVWSRRVGYLAAALPILMLASLYLLARSALTQPWVIAGLLVTLLMSWLLLVAARQPAKLVTPPPAQTIISLSGWSALLSICALAVIASVTAAPSLNTVMLIIPQIVLLSPEVASRTAPNFASMAELVNSNLALYGAYFNSLLWAPFIAGALGIGLGWLWERRPWRA
jgi:hypothetical protein